jgi:hypothetical protein
MQKQTNRALHPKTKNLVRDLNAMDKKDNKLDEK